MKTEFRRFCVNLHAASAVVFVAASAHAAEVTPQRLVDAAKEPQNWLMNHGTYDAQRYSGLARIDKSNVKNLKLVYATALGGGSAGEHSEATPLAEDGFLYITDSWGVLTKVDARSGDRGRIVWRMDPKQQKQRAARGATFWGNLVITPANWPARMIAVNKDTGQVVWETNLVNGQDQTTITGAPLAIRDKIVIGASGGDLGVRDWIAALDGATGKQLWLKYTIPAPGEPGSETWKDKNNNWQTGGGAMWVAGSYDPETHQTLWGVGNPMPMMDPYSRPGDNLFTNSLTSWNPDTGQMLWYFQYTPNDGWDFDEVGSHILFDAQVNGQKRKLLTHSARNGFTYTMERANGQMVAVKPYMEGINWTKGIDQKTGKPVDYDPSRDVQVYSGLANPTKEKPISKVCPSRTGGNNFWPSSYSQKTGLLYIPALTACELVTNDIAIGKSGQGWAARPGGGFKIEERYESDLTAVDPITGDIRKSIHLKYPNYAGALTTAGGLVFTGYVEGTFAAYDEATLEELWKINVGTGFSAPPMTFEAGGKQFVAIVSGPSGQATHKLIHTPEEKESRNSMMLFVFGL